MSDNHYWDDFEIHDGNFDQQKSEPESRLSKRSNSGISDFDNDSFRISEIEPINPLAITTDATISTTAAVKSNNKNSSLYRFSELSTIKDEVVKPSPSQFTTTTTTTTTSSNIKKYENSTSFKNNIDSSTTNSFKIPDIPKSSSSIPISTKVPLSIEQQQALVMPSIAKSKNDEIEIDGMVALTNINEIH